MSPCGASGKVVRGVCAVWSPEVLETELESCSFLSLAHTLPRAHRRGAARKPCAPGLEQAAVMGDTQTMGERRLVRQDYRALTRDITGTTGVNSRAEGGVHPLWVRCSRS